MDGRILPKGTEASVEEIRVLRPSYDSRELEAIAEVLAEGWTGLGPRTAEFENQFARHISAAYCVGLSSGTASIQIALKLLDIQPGDRVIIPTVTFVSAAICVINAGAVPVFCDVLPETCNIDPAHAASLKDSRTRAVIPVHLAGYPVDIPELRRMVGDIPVIEDCAHGAGSYLEGRHVGTSGEVGCFSFHAVKNLSMGEGGALVTADREMAERARRLRWLGIDRDTWDRSTIERSYWWEYSLHEPGLNCHMNDIHAAIGLVQLAKLEKANERRREIAALYRQGLGEISQVSCPPEENSRFRSSWHLFRISTERRDELNTFLAARGISTGVHYKPLHMYSCFGDRPKLPVAEKAFETMLTLPMYPDLSDAQVMRIIDSVREFHLG